MCLTLETLGLVLGRLQQSTADGTMVSVTCPASENNSLLMILPDPPLSALTRLDLMFLCICTQSCLVLAACPSNAEHVKTDEGRAKPGHTVLFHP